MSQRATRYCADDYVFLLGGLAVDSGRGPDTFLTVAQNADTSTYQAGIDGEGVFSESKDNSATITLTLMQTSAGNALLSEMYRVQQATGTLLPCSGQDSRGTSKMASEACKITRLPDETFAKEAGTVEWTIIAHNLIRQVGSH